MYDNGDMTPQDLMGHATSSPCAICELPKPKSQLIIVPAETIGQVGGGSVDLCADCYNEIQRGEIEPPGDIDP